MNRLLVLAGALLVVGCTSPGPREGCTGITGTPEPAETRARIQWLYCNPPKPEERTVTGGQLFALFLISAIADAGGVGTATQTTRYPDGTTRRSRTTLYSTRNTSRAVGLITGSEPLPPRYHAETVVE